METYTLPYVKQIARKNSLGDTGSSTQCSVTTYRVGKGRVSEGREGTYVYLWLIHVDVCGRGQHDIVKPLPSN